MTEHATGQKLKQLFDTARFIEKACSISFRDSINDYKTDLETNFTVGDQKVILKT